VYLGGVIVFGTNLVVTAVVLIVAAVLWRRGHFRDVEGVKYRMMEDDQGSQRVSHDE
jgi:hypothetical protein